MSLENDKFFWEGVNEAMISSQENCLVDNHRVQLQAIALPYLRAMGRGLDTKSSFYTEL